MNEVLPRGCQVCAECGATTSSDGARLDRHHIDGNHDNDVVENVQWLCHPCHTRHHALGRTHSEATKRKLRGHPVNKATRQKISKALRGRIFSDEWRRKISDAKRGHPVSEATRQKNREAQLEKTLTEEHKRKIGAANRVRVVREETKQKLQGRIFTEETRQRMRDAQRRRRERECAAKLLNKAGL